MSITNTTYYTFEVMMAFHRHHRSRQKWLHIVCDVVLALYLAVFILLCCLSLKPNATASVGFEEVLLAVLSATILGTEFALPRLFAHQSRKNPALGARVDYAFYDEVFTETSQSEKITESSTVHYSAIHRVTESDTAIYLYVSPVAAHIIDKNGFASGDVAILKQLLRDRIDPKKIKFQ